MNKIFKNEFKRESSIMFYILLVFIFINFLIKYEIYSLNYKGPSLFLINFNIIIMCAFFIPFALFKYLNNQEMLDLINSLPITKGQMFKYKYIIGILYISIPFFIVVTITLIMDSLFFYIPIEWSINFILLIIKYYLYSIVVYSISVFVCTVTGNTIYSFLGSFYLICLGLFLASGGVKNFKLRPYGSFYLSISEFLLPIIDLYKNLYSISEYLVQIIITIIIIAIIYYFSKITYKKRKTEKSSDVIVFEKLKKFLIFLILIPVCFFISIMYVSVTFNLHYGITYIKIVLISFFIFLIVGSFILNCMIEKNVSFKNLKNIIIPTVMVYLITTGIILYNSYKMEEYYINENNNSIISINYIKNDSNISKYIESKEGKKEFNKVLNEIIETTPKNDRNFGATSLNYKDVNISYWINNINYSTYNKLNNLEDYFIDEVDVVKNILNSEQTNISIIKYYNSEESYYKYGVIRNFLLNDYLYYNYDKDYSSLKNVLLEDINNLNGYNIELLNHKDKSLKDIEVYEIMLSSNNMQIEFVVPKEFENTLKFIEEGM